MCYSRKKIRVKGIGNMEKCLKTYYRNQGRPLDKIVLNKDLNLVSELVM